MGLTFGFSPCPNDTFIFNALVNQKIDTGGLDFKFVIRDVESLNKSAFQNEFDITKISYHAYAHVYNDYQLLNSGSALGFNNGPLIISKHKIFPDELKDVRIAIPGRYTTASLIMAIAFPDATRTTEYLFSDIEEVVLSNEADAGLIIHENRFTYHKKGLKLVADLGEWWGQHIKTPVPLGAIVIKRDLPSTLKQQVDKLIQESVLDALGKPDHALLFARKYAASMDVKVMKQHISLYVNDFTVSLGEAGRQAIVALYENAGKSGVIPQVPADIFID